MRLPLMSPSALKSDQHRLYDDMRQSIEANFKVLPRLTMQAG